jgi:hypothetical protein|tara:strand:- start:368 stop:1669 length:1302 start_codon:yes stop_codon:yes gene_type:complete
MADELDKTIEELEAEVLDELEEANGADAPKKNAGKAETMDKIEGDGATAPTQDTGKAVVSPDQKDAPAKKVAAAAKEVSGDAQQKGEGKPDAMPAAKGDAKENKPLAAGHVPEGEENLEEMQKQEMMKKEMKGMTKEMMKQEMAKKMGEMKKDDLMAAYDAMMNKEMMAKDEEPTDEEKAKSEAVEKRVKEIDVKEHVDALMNGEGDLSEEFKRKAATVFEAAVKSKVRDEVSRIEDDYRKELDENINANKDELTTKVDTYLNYVCEEWTKENELAIERGLKGEIAEDFISGLKQLFEDHYIDVPNEKYDVLEAQSEKISQLEAKLNEAIEKNVSMKTDNAKLVREQVISEMSSDLAETEIEKFKSLTEDVDFEDEASYKEKLETLKENYFPKQKTVVAETVDNVETGNAQDIDVSNSMTAYMSAIGRVAKGQ